AWWKGTSLPQRHAGFSVSTIKGSGPGAGCAVDGDDWIQVDQHGRTSVPGIWAAGNVISSPDQIVNAAAAGATAAININDTLLGLA
ncbi:FAD-dependent oxidoreductase, partial [Corynebacterium frankenforstense]